MPVLDDWVLELGFDSKKVENGLKDIEKLMAKVAKLEGIANGIKGKGNTLLSARNSLSRKLSQAESLGIKVDKERNMLSSKNAYDIRTTTLLLDKQVIVRRDALEAQKKLNAETAKAPKVKTATETPKPKVKTPTKASTEWAGAGQKSKFVSESSSFNAETRAQSVANKASQGLKASGLDPKTVARLEIAQGRAEKLGKALRKTADPAKFQRLNRTLTKVRQSISDATAQQKRFNTQLSTGAKMANGFKQSLNNMARSYVSVFAAVGAATAALKVGADLDSIQASMLAASGNAKNAAVDFEYVKGVSFAMGKDLRTTARAFSQIGTASRLAGLGAKETKKMFTELNESMVGFGLSEEDAKGSLRAVTQMLSKGQVMAEELKNQLGERMPAALQAMANVVPKAGGSIQKLFKIMERGELMSTEVVPKFAEELSRMVKESGAYAKGLKTISVAQGKFKFALQNSVGNAFASGGKSGLVSLLGSLTGAMIGLKPAFKTLGTIVGGFFHLLSTALNFVTPIFAFFSSLLERFTRMIKDAFDLSKPLKDLSLATTLLRGLAWAVKLVQAAFLGLGWIFAKVSEAIHDFTGKTEGAAGATTWFGEAVDLLALALGSLLTLKVGAWFLAIGKGILSISKFLGFGGLIGMFTGGGKVSKFFSFFTKTGKILSALRIGLLALTGPVGLIVAGVLGLITAGSMLSDYVGSGDTEHKEGDLPRILTGSIVPTMPRDNKVVHVTNTVNMEGLIEDKEQWRQVITEVFDTSVSSSYDTGR